MERARTGGGVFVEYGSHSLDLARWIIGEPGEVCANMRTIVAERPDPSGGAPRPVDVDDVCSWLASLEGGVEAVFHASWVSLNQPWGDLAVFGGAGGLVWRRGTTPGRSPTSSARRRRPRHSRRSPSRLG
jgi:predicted dehydrogenase